MKNFIKLIALFSILLSLSLIASSVLGSRPVFAQLPFGGQTTLISPCTSGQFLVMVVNPGGIGSGTILLPIFPLLLAVGNYAPAPVPCLWPPPPFSVIVGYGYPAIIFGIR
ncbi:MAG: hypothetical protein NTX00_00675 [Candidatus Parcubacteria bacterium]|nr:hypothetical protein [Candidatus Parcubacteria bacterium]